MILPARPLRLRAAYFVLTWRRILALLLGIGVGGLLVNGLVWGAIRGLLVEVSAAHGGHEVELLDVDIGDSRGLGPVHIYYLYLATREDGVERSEHAGPFLVLGGPPPDPVDVHAYRDVRSGLLCTTIEAAQQNDRVVTAVILVIVFGGAVGYLVWLLLGRIREHLDVLRASRSGKEVLLDVASDDGLSIGYRVTERIEGDEGGYRTAARAKGWLSRYRQRSDEEKPLIVSSAGGQQLLGLRLPGSRRVVIVRKDFWPFAIEGTKRTETLNRLAEATR